MKTKCRFCDFETNTTTWKTYYEHRAHLKNNHGPEYTEMLCIEVDIHMLKSKARDKYGMAAYNIGG